MCFYIANCFNKEETADEYVDDMFCNHLRFESKLNHRLNVGRTSL